MVLDGVPFIVETNPFFWRLYGGAAMLGIACGVVRRDGMVMDGVPYEVRCMYRVLF